MTRQALLRILKRAGFPTCRFAGLSDAAVFAFAEGPGRDRVKDAEAVRLHAYAEKNREVFARYGQKIYDVVRAFRTGPELFCEQFVDGGIDLDDVDLSKGPDFRITGDEADKPERKILKQTSLDKNKKSALTREEKLAKHREKIKLRKWAEQNRRELESYGTTPERVVGAFASNDEYTRCSQFIGH